MIYEITLKENSPFSTYCPRPLVQGDVRAYSVVIKTEQSLEGASLVANAIKSDGQMVSDIGEVHTGYAQYTLSNNMYDVEGEMRLMLTVVDYDGSALTAKEVIFTVAPSASGDAIDGDDRFPALNQLINRCNNILSNCMYLEEKYGVLVTNDINLIKPENITAIGTNNTVYVDGLVPGRAYSFNFIPLTVMGITETGEAEMAEVYHYKNCTYIKGEDMKYTALSIPFSPSYDHRFFMLVEGTQIPPYYKPYASDGCINDELLKSVYAEIEKNLPSINPIDSYSYEVPLRANSISKITIDKDLRFVLPETYDYSQILVQAEIIAGGEIVDWGTTHFFSGEVPTVEVGRYNFIFEYDGGAWYAGAIEKGQVTQ